jgi:soluble lytic murein transglycosylase
MAIGGPAVQAQIAPERSLFPAPRLAAGRAAPARGAAPDAAPDAATARLAQSGAVGASVARWIDLRTGEPGLAETLAFVQGHPHWPDIAQLRRRAEAQAAQASASQLRAFFASDLPRTGAGLVALIAVQDAAQARDTLRAVWPDISLEAAQEQAILARFGRDLADLHPARLDTLISRGETAGAQRMLAHVSADQAALGRARLALRARAAGVDTLVAAVPRALADHPALAFDRATWRVRAENFLGAEDIILAHSPDRLGRAEDWVQIRQRLVRRAITEGRHQRAYDLARTHGLNDGAGYADLEWLAGFVALRHLNRPDAALTHFRALRVRVSSPISLGRAGYWEGRALESMGQTEQARAAYDFGAQHQSGYYGQLAAERIGLALDPSLASPRRYPDWQGTALARSDLMQAAILLHQAGRWHDARRFVIHLAQTLTREDELGALADYWLARNEPNFAVNVAKIAVQSGHVLARANFPLTGLERLRLPVAPELVLAIARRESEFDPAVISSADARGLMQVLPATGAQVARRMGITDFRPQQLTSDPARNVTLGAGYLAQMSERFNGALPLIAAAYNAGPGRPEQWIEIYGDPRDPRVDPVDWVEMIPFAETRNYVMRVLETLVVYRAQLSGDRTIRLTPILRGR